MPIKITEPRWLAMFAANGALGTVKKRSSPFWGFVAQ
jgi:hypothetical protein